MTPTETVTFLRYLSSLFPTFTWQPDTPAAWHNAGLHKVTPRDAKAASLALATRAAFVSLDKLLAEVTRIRDERLAAHQVPAPNTDDPSEYRQQLLSSIAAAADGLHIDTPRALPAGQRRIGPPPIAWQQARGISPSESQARAIECPWPPCQAQPNSSCVNGIGRPLARSHEARHHLAAQLAG
ncbi:hypothetical protein ITP53_11445 [Nonomuraea sp. K274]|uniref:DNA-binding phage zinc finger domain-containing protein n=1 Tax=Nonomuraea cypriaca TaxID=1187855 RepID=A0A931F0H1_9ACTN|nr:hypothetical protein [Nonomuraea cypriaca]MBF8186353.1 hypothetical protein [Nonomuraea cypriaca]